MTEFITKLNEYRSAMLPENEFDLAKLNALNNELQVVLKHSADKVTFGKDELNIYHDLGFRYKMIEGFNLAIDYLKTLIDAEKVEEEN